MIPITRQQRLYRRKRIVLDDLLAKYCQPDPLVKECMFSGELPYSRFALVTRQPQNVRSCSIGIIDLDERATYKIANKVWDSPLVQQWLVPTGIEFNVEDQMVLCRYQHVHKIVGVFSSVQTDFVANISVDSFTPMAPPSYWGHSQ